MPRRMAPNRRNRRSSGSTARKARLEASLDAIKTVRPAAEKFYASLSDEQKVALTEHRGHGWRDRGDDAGPDATPPAQPQ